MNIEWFSTDESNGFATLYDSNITLNSSCAQHFKDSVGCMLGLDRAKGLIIIKPVSKKDEVQKGIKDYNKISFKSSYARASNKSFMNLISTTFDLKLGSKGLKYNASWDSAGQYIVVFLNDGKL